MGEGGPVHNLECGKSVLECYSIHEQNSSNMMCQLILTLIVAASRRNRFTLIVRN